METSFEVVTILFNFHRWTCVVGLLALAMSLTKVLGISSRLKKRLFLGVFILFISEKQNLHLRKDQQYSYFAT